MDIGMLWYDDSDKPLDKKIERAAEYYKAKYAKSPDLCFVNPAQVLPDSSAQPSGIRIVQDRTVIHNHLWIGVDVKA